MPTRTFTEPKTAIDPQRWNQLKSILDQALREATPKARVASLRKNCGQDAVLLREAESLLAASEMLRDEPTDWLEAGAEKATGTLWDDVLSREAERIGAYVIVRELGRGGMGAVYLAERADGEFQKQVAIKILKRGTDTEEILHRFKTERQIVARLEHPNIVRLLDAGTTADGLPYFVMELVAGVPVTRFLCQKNLSIPARLELFLKICSAVEVAHKAGVVHRDLKPRNILITADGEPKLLDFGIAKLLAQEEGAEDSTAVGRQRLTPQAASPEQARGEAITLASDVYALGGLLYQMLTDALPHRFSVSDPSRAEVVRVICEGEIAEPSRVVPEMDTRRQLRGDLDHIVLHAMRKEPTLRYPTVAEFAEDIRRHLHGEAVKARPATLAYQAQRLVARNRPTRRIAAALALLLIAGVGVGLWLRSPLATRESAAITSSSNPVAPSESKSIAVLPFDNLGSNNSSSYFADGVQDNILNDLGKVGDLKVISRSGVASYRGKTHKVKEIGRELGVANVLEGSVQISGDRVRINAQLVDTRSDTQLWAEHYDRKIEDLFALQSELAQTIVEQLKATLSTGERAAIWKRPTEDMQAYDLYLRARADLNGWQIGDPDTGLNEGVSFLHAAVARDPKFALAYCVLNEADLYVYRHYDDHTPARLQEARDAAETALRLEPNLEEAHLALARYYYDGLGDYRRTQEELLKLAANGGHGVEFFTLASLVERRLGQWTESVRDGERAVDLDPQNGFLSYNLVQTLTGLKRYQESDRVASAAILRVPSKSAARLWLLKDQLEVSRGNLAAAHAAVEMLPEKADIDSQLPRIWMAFFERDFDRAKQLFDNRSPEVAKSSEYFLIAGRVARVRGDADEARRLFEEARRLAADSLEKRPNNPAILSELAFADAGLDRKEDALREAHRAVELMPIAADAVEGPPRAVILAQIFVWAGDHESALNLLSELLRVPFGPSYGELMFDPMWDQLRGDVRFDRLVADAKALASNEGHAESAPR